jgi:uncharacterized protein YjlB
MYETEELKKTVEKLTGRGRPDARQLEQAIWRRRPSVFRFEDSGLVPNNRRFPFIVYRSAVKLLRSCDPAAIFEELFAHNGWSDSWRNGIYDYVHYHPGIHEVLGIARGNAVVQFGGSAGRKVKLKAGDVAILPAGTGHQCLRASNNLLVVGAYPSSGKYTEFRPTNPNHKKALASIPRVPVPRKDPVYGRDGPLRTLWVKQTVEK